MQVLFQWNDLKSERIRKRILRFFTKHINPRSLGSWCLKGTEESTLGVFLGVFVGVFVYNSHTHAIARDIARFSPG